MAKSFIPKWGAVYIAWTLISASASEPASIRIEAQTLSSAREVKTTRTKTTNAYKRQEKTRRVVGVEISTTKHEPQSITLEGLLVIEREGEERCESLGKRHLKEVEAGRPQRIEFSTKLEASIQRKSQGETTKKGDRYKGWVIRAYDSNRQVVAVAASLKHFEALAYEEPIR